MTIIGSDGKPYSFLLKGKEDLHIDAHLLQFTRLANELLNAHKLQAVQIYSVTPLGDQIGLIQWMEQTVPFYALFREWQTRQLKKLKELNGSLPEPRSIGTVITHHPKEAFQKELAACLNEANIPRSTARNAIPMEILNQVSFDVLWIGG